MKLNRNGMKDYGAWEANKVELPKFDYEKMKKYIAEQNQ